MYEIKKRDKANCIFNIYWEICAQFKVDACNLVKSFRERLVYNHVASSLPLTKFSLCFCFEHLRTENSHFCCFPVIVRSSILTVQQFCSLLCHIYLIYTAPAEKGLCLQTNLALSHCAVMFAEHCFGLSCWHKQEFSWKTCQDCSISCSKSFMYCSAWLYQLPMPCIYMHPHTSHCYRCQLKKRWLMYGWSSTWLTVVDVKLFSVVWD